MLWRGRDEKRLAAFEDYGLGGICRRVSCFEPRKDAIVFVKTGYSSYLPEMKEFEKVYICGFDTDACVYKTAMDLAELGVCPVVLKDCCSSATQEAHEMGLKLLERNIGKKNVL